MRCVAATLAIMLVLPGAGLLPLLAADEGPPPAAVPAARPSGPTVTTSSTPTTRLYVKTVPPGAQVTLDGKPLGPSDGLFIVPPGISSVKVEFEGGEPQERVVEIAAGRITRLELDFAKPEAARPEFKIDRPKTREEAGLPAEPAYVDPGRAIPKPVGGDVAVARDVDLPAAGGPWLAAGRVLRVPPPSPRGVEMPTASEIDTALLRPLPEDLIFDGVPLGDVLKQLGRVGEVRLSIDEPALHKQGVDLDAAITARPGGVPLGDALSEIVRTKQLRWLPDDGGIVVTTRDSAKELIDRPYRVDDLLDPSDPAGFRLAQFLSEASWPVEPNSVTGYRELTIGRSFRQQGQGDHQSLDRFVVHAEWWRQWRTARLLALLRQLQTTPVGDRRPLSVDGYWSDSAAAAAARAALDRPLERDLAAGLPLGEAIAALSKEAGVPIEFDALALALVGFSLNEPIALKEPTKGRTLAAVLQSILAEHDLDFDLARGRLAVTPWVRNIFATAYYPVDDLLAAGHTFDSLRETIAKNIVAMPRPWVPTAFADARWEGGLIWVIEGGVNCLAITQTTAGHRAVEKILRQLRAAAKEAGAEEVLPAQQPTP